mgnify:CR=1 FL=1
MQITLRYFDGCPNWRLTEARVKEALAAVGASEIGITYERADGILHWLLSGYRPEQVAAMGYTKAEVELVRARLDGTHWKRRLPTVAMLSQTAIGEYYLRPVDY